MELVTAGGRSSITVLGAPAQVFSLIAEALSRGAGVTSEKSVALSLLSSLSSSSVGQPGSIVLRIALPAPIPPGETGEPTVVPVAVCSAAAPVKLPQATQSAGRPPAFQQAAPPAAGTARPLSTRSGASPNLACTPLSPTSTVLWLAPLATPEEKVEVCESAPAEL